MASRASGRVLGWFLVGVAALGLAACKKSAAPQSQTPGQGGEGAAEGVTRIVVTIPPLRWAVEGLALQDAAMTLIVPPGASAHGYELTPSQSAAIARADLVVMVGLGMEPRVEAALAAHANDQRRVIRFADVLSDDDLLDASHDGHDHAHDDGHHHHSVDPHAWLDPILMGRFVEMLSEEMERASGGQGRPGEIAMKAVEMQAECASIDAAYRAALQQAATKQIVTHHNAYSYLAHRYGLVVAAVIQGGVAGGGGHGGEPTPGEIADAVRAVRASGARAVFVERQISDISARRVAEAAGVPVLVLDPLGDGDWPVMMRKNLEALIEGLGVASGDNSAGG